MSVEEIIAAYNRGVKDGSTDASVNSYDIENKKKFDYPEEYVKGYNHGHKRFIKYKNDILKILSQ